MIRLVGYLDSPFVRRVAVSAQFLGVPYEHEELSIFRDYDRFRELNPLVKVPTVITETGEVLTDSTLIIDYMERASGKSIMPDASEAYTAALRLVGIALVAGEKVAQLIYETKQRPAEKQHEPWVQRIREQLCGAVDLLEEAVGDGEAWLHGSRLTQADITVAIVWRFVQHVEVARLPAEEYPGLARFSARAEALPEFIACPLS